MTVLLSVIVLLLVVSGMAIGVMMGRKPIKGSCGGLNAIGIDGECEICGGNPAKCDAEDKSLADSQLLDSQLMDSQLLVNAMQKKEN